jgi:hypothetical protein
VILRKISAQRKISRSRLGEHMPEDKKIARRWDHKTIIDLFKTYS